MSRTILITENAKRIVIKHPPNAVEVIDDMIEHWKLKDIWPLDNHHDVSAYIGREPLYSIDMSKVLGIGK